MNLRYGVVLSLLSTAVVATVGCGNKDAASGTSGGATTAPPPPPPPIANTAAKPSGAAPAPAATAAAAVTPKAMPPFEALSFKQTADKPNHGWPTFDATNL